MGGGGSAADGFPSNLLFLCSIFRQLTEKEARAKKRRKKTKGKRAKRWKELVEGLDFLLLWNPPELATRGKCEQYDCS